jgi:hypothetical protein
MREREHRIIAGGLDSTGYMNVVGIVLMRLKPNGHPPG